MRKRKHDQFCSRCQCWTDHTFGSCGETPCTRTHVGEDVTRDRMLMAAVRAARAELAEVRGELAEQRERIAAAIEAELPSEDERGFATFTLWLDNGWTREQADELFTEIAEVGHDPKWEQGVFLSGSFSQTHDPYDAGIERAARIAREGGADR